MALLWEVAVFFHKVVVAAGVTGAKLVEISASRGRVGRGGVGGCVYIISRSDKGLLGNGG
jgi:hypothetical protein